MMMMMIKCCVIDWRVVFICYNTSGWETSQDKSLPVLMSV